MDLIKYDKTLYYNYSYKFDYNISKLNFCKFLKEKWGWQNFNFTEHLWRAKTVGPILDIKKRYPGTELDDICTLELSMVLEDEYKKIKELEKIKEYNITVDGLKTTLRQYQQNTVGFFIENGGRGLMCLDPGCGKTVCSLAYAVHTKKARILVVCPNSMKGTWYDETKKFTSLRPFIFNGNQDYSEFELKNNYDLFIINYDMLKILTKSTYRMTKTGKKNVEVEPNELFLEMGFDLMIVDEATMIKGYSAQRTKRAVVLSRYINSILLLTGTPIINSPQDLFVPLNIIDYDRFNSFFKFVHRFCDPIRQTWGWDFSGSSNMDELRDIIKPYYVRYAKRDVLDDLPPIIFTDMPVDLRSEYNDKYKMAIKNLVEYLKTVRKKSDKETQRSMRAQKLVLLNELRQITSASKSMDAQEVIENIVNSGEKVVVFSNFHEPLKNLHKIFDKNSVLLLGDSSDKEREDAKNRFQNDEKIRIFFGGTKASGIGITLNRAENVLFIDQPWTAADYEQAYSRSERIGNKAPVINIRTMYVSGSVDEKIANIIKKKKEIANFIFNNDTEYNIIEEIVDSLEGAGG